MSSYTFENKSQLSPFDQSVNKSQLSISRSKAWRMVLGRSERGKDNEAVANLA
jgi:hypothetical protein